MADGHATHDLERIVALVDGALEGEERELAEHARLDCAECSRLAADITVLALRTKALPVPPRTRDFRLTQADAVRLRSGSMEPRADGARLVGDMTRTLRAHEAHDPTLIAASIDGALTDTERRLTADWLASCADCVALRDDLVAISAAHRAMPTPPRPKDFRLTDDDIHRLRRAGWRELLSWVGGTRDGLTRPLAAGLTTLGLAGLLFTTVPSFLSGASTSAAPAALPAATLGAAAPAYESAQGGASTIPDLASGLGSLTASAAPSMAPGASSAGAPGAQSSGGGDAAPISGPSQDVLATEAAPVAGDGGSGKSRVTGGEATADDGLVAGGTSDIPVGRVASLLALVAGLGLFGTRWRLRRSRGR